MQALNYADVLLTVGTEASVATEANFRAVAAGTVAYMVGHVWATKEAAVPATQIRADLLAMFATAHKKGKTAKYDFANLALQAARFISKGHAWGKELADQADLPAAITFLAARFGGEAKSVSALAEFFNTGRNQAERKTKTPLELVRALADKLRDSDDGAAVPFAMVVKEFGTWATPDSAFEVIGTLLAHLDSDALAAVIENANSAIMARQQAAAVDATAQAMAQAA